MIKSALACLRKVDRQKEPTYDTYLEFPSLKAVMVAKSAVYRFFTLMCGLIDTKVR